MHEQIAINEVTVRDYVRVLFRHQWVILTTIVTVMATVIIGVMMNTKVYEAEVTMLISGLKQAQAEYYTDIGISGMRSTQITLTQTQIATSDPVLERAVVVIGLGDKPLDYEADYASKIKLPFIKLRTMGIEKRLKKLTDEQRKALRNRLAMEDLRNRIDVDPVRETDLFRIKVKDYNPVGAAVTANVVSRSYAIFDLEQQLAEMQLKFGDRNLAVVQLQEAIQKMAKSLNGAPLPPLEAIGPATVKIIEQAKVPIRPAGISRVAMVLLGLFFSIFLSIMMAFSFEYMNQTFKSPQEVESVLALPYLGSLPRKREGVPLEQMAEKIVVAAKERDAKVILFACATDCEDITGIMADLGTAMAKNLHKRVLLINGNVRSPKLHEHFELPPANNLMNVIEGKFQLEKAVTTVAKNLDVITSNIAAINQVTILESGIMRALFEAVKIQYDLILVDSAPLGQSKDTILLSNFADALLMMVNEGKTRRFVAKNAIAPLLTSKEKFLGVILNDRQYVIPKFIYNRV